MSLSNDYLLTGVFPTSFLPTGFFLPTGLLTPPGPEDVNWVAGKPPV